MPRMIELIREQAVPANIVRMAAKGALSVPPPEMLEILVFLTRNPVFGQDARLTLAGWDESLARAALADPQTPPEVLDYFVSPENLRPALLSALISNSAVSEDKLLAIAADPSADVARILIECERSRRSPAIMRVLASNTKLPEDIHRDAAAFAGGETSAEADEYLKAHAAEIAAEEGKPFELVGGPENPEEEEVLKAPAKPVVAERERISPLQKIARMSVGERVKLAMRGSKDERAILVRDGSRLVSSAVLASPKLTDQEVETFATMKNVTENVLREIVRSRKFMKKYSVVRNLANNPRTPLDLALPLLKHLLVLDLRALSANKNIGEVVRKTALKLFKEKSAPPGKRSE